MKKTLTTIVSAIMFLFAGTALAEEHEAAEAEGAEAFPVETWTCDYNEGKGPADLQEVIDEWNDWMDDQGQTTYFAATVTPHYFGERAFDVGWLGAWKDGNAMGAGTDLWLTEGSDLADKFFEVISCKSHTSFVVWNLREGPDPDEDDHSFVLGFSNCSFEDQKNYEDLGAAQQEWNAYADEHGIVGGAWVFMPLAGETDDSYDFKYVDSVPDHTTFGANWQLYSEGHHVKAGELFDDILDCDVSRIYNATVHRRIPDTDE